MIKITIKTLVLSILISFSFADSPDWDCDGDGVLDNLNDFQSPVQDSILL